MNNIIINIVSFVNKIVEFFLGVLPISYYLLITIILHMVYIGLHAVIILRISGKIPSEIMEHFREKEKPRWWNAWFGMSALILGLTGLVLYTRTNITLEQRALSVISLILYETDFLTLCNRDKTSKWVKTLVWGVFIIIFFIKAMNISLRY